MPSKHTPGPWEATCTTGAGWSVRRMHERPGYKGLAPICSMAWWQFDIPDIIDDNISSANAHLIAAAPDLLAACRAADDAIGEWLYDGQPKEHNPSEALEMLRAAIAKATEPQP